MRLNKYLVLSVLAAISINAHAVKQDDGVNEEKILRGLTVSDGIVNSDTVGSSDQLSGQIEVGNKLLEYYQLQLKILKAKEAFRNAEKGFVADTAQVDVGLPNVNQISLLSLEDGDQSELPLIANISGSKDKLKVTTINSDGSIEYSFQGDALSTGHIVESISIDKVVVRKGLNVSTLSFSGDGQGLSVDENE
jgi:hypothetical protein